MEGSETHPQTPAFRIPITSEWCSDPRISAANPWKCILFQLNVLAEPSEWCRISSFQVAKAEPFSGQRV
jgi:hypothetical protein